MTGRVWKMSMTGFITGATGNIGGRLTSRILNDEPDARLILLVRGDSSHQAWERVENSYSFATAQVRNGNGRQAPVQNTARLVLVAGN